MSIIIGETPSTGNDYKETAKDLCRALLEDEKLKGVFASIDAFMENDVSKELFSQMQTKGEELQTKQQAGIELTAGDAAAALIVAEGDGFARLLAGAVLVLCQAVAGRAHAVGGG